MRIRSSKLPDKPTLVLSSAFVNDGRFGVLREMKVEAIMESFEILRRLKDPSTVFDFMDWPARRYMDSGLFSLMTKAGTHRIQSGRKKGKTYDFISLAAELKSSFIEYLKVHANEWDHIVEMDTDNIPGLGVKYALETREELHEILGDKLMPVWHFASESIYDDPYSLNAWKRMVRDFPYIAIGGDKVEDKALYRHMTRIAHANGVIVHRLGCTDPDDAKEVGWDTGDSTNWLSGARYGNFTLFQYGRGKASVVEASRERRIRDFLEKKGISPDDLLDGKGNARRSQLLVGIFVQIELQNQLRKFRKLGVD